MALKSYKPITPGRRQMTTDTFEDLTSSKPQKNLTKAVRKKAGRNNQGRLTVRHKGGGHKRRYRLIDFKRTDKLNIPGKVATIEYDPNRSAYIMLVNYVDGDKRYHIAPDKMEVGTEIIIAEKTKVKVGNRLMVKNIPVGYSIYNVELQPGRGGQTAKSAGASAKIVSLEGVKAQLELPSGEIRLIEKTCYATIGIVSNLDYSNITIGKAGRNRWLGKRPEVRGKAMNPCDHPHGGGEGATSIGMKAPKTPWGMPALGLKTRKRKYTNSLIVKSRRSLKRKKR